MIWLVYRGDTDWEEVKAVCADLETAMRYVEREKKWVENYHGPSYPVEWQGLNPIRAHPYSEEIRWEPREFDA